MACFGSHSFSRFLKVFLKILTKMKWLIMVTLIVISSVNRIFSIFSYVTISHLFYLFSKAIVSARMIEVDTIAADHDIIDEPILNDPVDSVTDVPITVDKPIKIKPPICIFPTLPY